MKGEPKIEVMSAAGDVDGDDGVDASETRDRIHHSTARPGIKVPIAAPMSAHHKSKKREERRSEREQRFGQGRMQAKGHIRAQPDCQGLLVMKRWKAWGRSEGELLDCG